MAHHPAWQTDSTKPVSSELVPPQTTPPEAVPSTTEPAADNLAAARQELAELAAKFAAHGGGNPLTDIPAEFAPDVALNEIADQACLATSATGAMIALARGGEMICHARSGSDVPELGLPLDMNSKFLVVCARTRQVQRCDDVLNEPTDESDIPRESGVGSVVVLPLMRNEELIGIFEVISLRTHAFGDRDLQTLEVLAERIVKNTQAHQSSSVSAGLIGSAEEIKEPLKTELASFLAVSDELLETTEIRPVGRVDWLAGVMGAVLLAVAILMGAVLGMRLGWMSARAHPSPPRTATSAPVANPPVVAPTEGSAKPAAETAAAEMKPAKSQSEPRAKRTSPEGELRVYENGKEIFHVPPEADANANFAENREATEGRLQPAGLIELSPEKAEGILVHRVEPEYPEQALMQHVQGPVVLEVHADREGIVQDVTLVSGDLLLGEAATAAVRQWRFKPQRMNGQAVEMETKVTLRFTLPSS